jgi:hypothetical protein
MKNSEQVAMSVSCSGQLMKTQGENMKLVFLDFQRELTKRMLDHVNEILEPVNSTVAFFDKQLSFHEKNLDELKEIIAWAKKECDEEVGKASSGCSSKSTTMYKDCEKTFQKVSFLNFMCQPVTWGGSVCDGLDNLNVCAIFQPVLAIENVLPALRRELRNAFHRLDFEYNQTRHIVVQSNTQEVIQGFRKSMNQKVTRTLESVSLGLSIMHYVVGAIALLALPFSANLFLRKYLLSVKHDRDIESFGCCGSCREGKQHTFCLTLKVFFWLLKVFVTCAVFVFEYFVFWFTESIIENADYKFEFDGSIEFYSSLESNTFVANLIRSIYPDIAVNHRFNFTINPTACLPELVPLSGVSVYLCTGGLYIVLLVLALASTCLMKIRPSIADFFYFDD